MWKQKYGFDRFVFFSLFLSFLTPHGIFSAIAHSPSGYINDFFFKTKARKKEFKKSKRDRRKAEKQNKIVEYKFTSHLFVISIIGVQSQFGRKLCAWQCDDGANENGQQQATGNITANVHREQIHNVHLAPKRTPKKKQKKKAATTTISLSDCSKWNKMNGANKLKWKPKITVENCLACGIHLLHDQLANFNFAKLMALELYARKIKLFPKWEHERGYKRIGENVCACACGAVCNVIRLCRYICTFGTFYT